MRCLLYTASMVEEEIRRYAKVLEAVVKLSELSTRELERRLELGGGTLNRIFTGKIDLKLRHILLVLEVVGMKPERFFQLACARPPEPDAVAGSLAAEILESFQRFGYGVGRTVAAPSRPLTDEELDRRIEAALGRVLRKVGTEPADVGAAAITAPAASAHAAHASDSADTAGDVERGAAKPGDRTAAVSSGVSGASGSAGSAGQPRPQDASG